MNASYQDNVFDRTDGGGGYTNCLDLNFGGGTNVVNQTLTLVYSATYAVNFVYDIIQYIASTDAIYIQISEEDGGQILQNCGLYTATRNT
ncbi:hypothetical protein Sste5344_002503 [Sporothrix stenoceras]